MSKQQDKEYREKIRKTISEKLGVELTLGQIKPSYTDLENKEKGIYVRVFHPTRRPSKREIDFVINLKKKKKLDKVYVASTLGFSESAKKSLEETNIQAIEDVELEPPQDRPETTSKAKKAKKRISKKEEASLVKRARKILENYFKNVAVSEKKYESKGYIDIEARGPDSNLKGVIRVILSPSVGVRDVRNFNEYLEMQSEPTSIAALLTVGKVSPNAKLEAKEYEIEIMSAEEIGEDTVAQTKLKERLISGAKQMVKRMGYEPLPLSDKVYREGLKTYSSTLGDFLIAKDPKEDKYIVVLIPAEEIVRVATIREFKKLLEENNFKHGMIIARKKFTYTAVREASLNNLQILEKNHPVFDIYKHELVPLHELLTPQEEKELLEKYSTTKDFLPKIKEDDPAIKVLGGRPGQVVRIVRSEDAVSYRVIIPSQRTFITKKD